MTGSWTLKNSLQLFDFRSGEFIDYIEPSNKHETINGEFYYCTKFFKGSVNGDIILTGGSGSCTVEVINIKSMKVTHRFKMHKSVQCIDSTNTDILFGGMESAIKIAQT